MSEIELTTRPIRQREFAASIVEGPLGDLDPVLSRVYAARGVTSPANLDYGLAQLAPVGLLEGIDEAVALLRACQHQSIVVIGDFDADGATSTALVVRCLRAFGFTQVSYLVPNRFEFGYGLTPEIVRVAAERTPGLLLTVDNGVSSIDGAAEATRLGIPVLVTDHHLPGPELPQVAAMVNPNLQGSQFPSRNLAGVGVAFYLMAALGKALQLEGLTNAAKIPARFLDLVALGTVADVVPLDTNNRILVSQGLQRMRAGHCVPGIAALLELAGKQLSRVVSTDLGFAVGPRLNAAGRLEDMSLGIECLLSDAVDEARTMAVALEQINRERRQIESKMREQALTRIESIRKAGLPDCVCLYDKSWHQGVVGLVASKVKERCHRPVIAFARDQGDILKGSARSVPGVHIRDVLAAVATEHPDLIDKFGGHAMAAGLSLAESKLAIFKEAAARQLQRLYPDADFSGLLLTDGSLPPESLNLRFANVLREAGPWGQGFAEPLFEGDFAVLENRIVGDNHLKMRVLAESGRAALDAIAFNQADAVSICRGTVRLTYRLDVNEFRGRESAQLIVEQIAATGVTRPAC